MADCCCAPPPLNPDPHRGNVAYRRVLWAVLAINAVMFLIEIVAGLAAGSASLQADAGILMSDVVQDGGAGELPENAIRRLLTTLDSAETECARIKLSGSGVAIRSARALE